MKRYRVLAVVLGGAALVWAGYCAYRAQANLVTLNVRNTDVRQVVPKLEWQTWERILIHKDVSGNVTLNVRNVPLAEVLNIIGLQTGARWTSLYPIYSTRQSVLKLHQVVQGDIPAMGSGWLNIERAPSWKGAGSLFGNTARAANNLVSAQIVDKDLAFATLALSRFSQSQVVSEDSARGTINLKLDQVPFRKAVAKVASQVRRKWDQIYSIQPRNPGTVIVKRDLVEGDTNVLAGAEMEKIVVDTNQVVDAPKFDPVAQQQQIEAFLATMAPEERAKAEEQLAAMQQIQSLPEGERQQRMQEMMAQAQQSGAAGAEQRIQKRLRDGTTEQRVARDRQKLAEAQKRPQP